MPFINLSTGIRMHYRDGGEGKPIVFLPGLAATVDTWNYQILALRGRYRCVCVDLRGHGNSDKPCSDYSYDEMCGDLRALLTALDLRDVTLVGWSMGAGVGLKYVTDFDQEDRVTKLAMLGPATPRFLSTPSEPFGVDADTARASLDGMRVALPETMAAFASANFHRSDMQATSRWFLSLWLKMPAYVGYKYFETLLTEDLRDKLGAVDLPTLICHGRYDQVCHPGWSEYMAARIPDCRMVWFENSGHALMVEEPDNLSAELSKFVGN
ncbi:MAG: alpha/beta fold hydrolase [Gammaproteobacteria bacterium]